MTTFLSNRSIYTSVCGIVSLVRERLWSERFLRRDAFDYNRIKMSLRLLFDYDL